jgi:ADP-heptose:LPS heptosyltransferase
LARISLIGLPWARELVARYPRYIDEFIEFPGFPGIPEARFDPARLTMFLTHVQARQFDLAIQLHGSGLNSNAFVELLGARRSAGHRPPGGWSPSDGMYVEYTGHGSEVDRCLDAVDAAGAPARGRHLEFPVTPSDRAELAALPAIQVLGSRPYVCLHPGARHPVRRWPADRFAAVGRSLAESGWPVVVTGTADEAATASAIAAAIGQRAIDLSGLTSLGALGALIAGARLLIANDTGVAHLADALGTASVIAFTHTDPERWAARDRSLHRVAAAKTQRNPCRHDDGEAHRCLADACTQADRSRPQPGVGDIPIEAVLREVSDVLGAEAIHVA